MNIQLKCKYCQSTNEYPLKWVQTNQRVFCPCCCKSYEVLIQVGFDEAREEDRTVETQVEKLSQTVDVVEELVNKDADESPLTTYEQYQQTDDYDWIDIPF